MCSHSWRLTSVLSDVNDRILLTLILVAKLLLNVKRTDNNAKGPVQLSDVICRFLEESVQAGTDIWSKETCDQIVGAVRAESDSKLVILKFENELAWSE